MASHAKKLTAPADLDPDLVAQADDDAAVELDPDAEVEFPADIPPIITAEVAVVIDDTLIGPEPVQEAPLFHAVDTGPYVGEVTPRAPETDKEREHRILKESMSRSEREALGW